MPRIARPARALVVLLLVAAPAGCGDSDGSGGGSSEDRLAAMPGVRAASVGPQEVEDGVTKTVTVVDAEPDATADEIADALVAMGRTRPFRSALYLDAGTTKYTTGHVDAPSGIWGNDSPQEDAAERGALLVAGVAALPDAQVAVGAGAQGTDGAAVDLTLDTTDPGEVTAAAQAVLADPTLGTAREVSVTASEVTDNASTPVAKLSSASPMTPELLDGWKALVADASELESRSDVTTSFRALASVVPADSPEEITVVTLDLAFPAGTPAGGLTTQRYGDQLWPLIRPRLTFLRARPPGSILRVSAVDDRSGHDTFLEVTTTPDGARSAADTRGRTWNAEAASYLDR